MHPTILAAQSKNHAINARKPSILRGSIALFVSAASLLTGSSSKAATLYWDINGATANVAAAATGAWNGTSAFWNPIASGTGGTLTAATTAADDLFFSSGSVYTAGTITLSAARLAHSISFDDNIAMTLASGGLTLGSATAGSGVFVLASSNQTNTISSPITLAGDSTFQNAGTGALTITGGVTGAFNLSLANNSTNTAGITIGTAALNNTGNVTNSGTGAGGTSITASVGANVITVAQNSLTSALNLTGGLVARSAGVTLSSVAGSAGFTIATGAVTGTGLVTKTGAGTVTISSVIGNGAGGLAVSAGTLVVGNTANTFTGGVSINGATAVLQMNAATNNASSAPLGIVAGGTAYKTISIDNGGTFRPMVNYNVNVPTAALPGNGYVFSIGANGGVFDVPTGVTFTIDDGSGAGTALTNSQLQGSGTLVKTGPGILSLGNAATSNAVFTGQILVNQGILKLGALTAAGVGLGSTSANTVIASGAAFDINNNASTAAEPVTISGTGVSGGNVIFSSNAAGGSFSGPITLAASSQIGSTTAGTLTFNAGSTFALGANTLTIANVGGGRVFTDGVISGTGGVTVNGSGAGDYVPRTGHLYSGTTLLTAGFVAVDSDSAGPAGSPTSGPFGTGLLNLAGAQLRSSTTAARTIGNTVTISGDTNFYGVANERSLVFSGPVTLSGGTRTLSSTVGTFVAGASVVFNGAIGDGGGNLGLTKAGAGNLTLNGINTYTGGTTVTGGVLNLRGSIPTNTALTVSGGGTFSLANATAAPLTNVSALSLGTGTLAFDLGANTAGSDSIATPNTAFVSGPTGISISGIAGFGSSATYNLITAAGGGLDGGFGYSVTSAPGGFIYGVNVSNALVQLTLTPAAGVGTLYWQGGLGRSWSALNAGSSNWTTDAAGAVNAGYNPTTGNTVVFSAANASAPTITTTLDNNYAVNDLQFVANPAGVTAVSIAPGFETAGAMTIAPSSSAAGISVAANAGNVSISTPVAMGSSQTWSVDGTGANGSSLTVSGAVTGGGASGLSLSGGGAGIVTLSAAGGVNTYSGATSVGNGVILRSGATNSFSPNSTMAVNGTGVLRLNGFSNVVSSLSGNGTVENGHATAAATLTAGNASNTTFSGVIQNGGVGTLSLTKVGTGTLTLTGLNTYSANTTVSEGTLVAAGGSTSAGLITVANTTANAVLNVPTGGTMTGGTITAGTVSGSFGAVNVTGGTLTLSTPDASTDSISFGGGEGGYGAFTMSSGTFTQQRFMFGGIGTSTTLGGVGVGLITGGTVNSTGWIILARHGASTGILTTTGGVINHAGAANDIAIGLQGNGRAELNVAGGLIDNTGRRVTFSSGTGGTFHWTGTGVVNLNAGTLLTNSVNYDTNVASANASSYINFSGGTLKASSSSAVFLPAFTPSGTGVNRVFVNGAFGTFSGGAVIDTNGFDDTVGADLIAPTGNGVTSLSLDNAGSGYIGAPAVRILDDGNPSTATGYAVVGTDPSNGATFGKVTSVVITNPGVITGTPTVSLVGGGGTGAAVSVGSTGANTSGGLMKSGLGTLTLTGANTYTGATSVTNGSLTLAANGSLSGTSGLSVSSGARFNYSPTTPGGVVIGTGATLTLASNSSVSEAFDSTISVSGAATVSGAVNLIPTGSYVSGNTYTLLTAAGGLNGATYNVLNPTDFTFTTTVSPTSVQITPTGAVPLSAAYWKGGFAGSPNIWAASNGSTASNWTTDGAGANTPLVPGASADVFIGDSGSSPGNQANMILGTDMAVNSITINGTVTTPNNTSNVTLTNTGGSTLTIVGAGGSGINVNAGSGGVTLNANVAISNGQIWTNDSGNPLVLGGTVTIGANVLTIAGNGGSSIANFSGGAGLLTIAGGATSIANFSTGTGGLTVSAGSATITAATLLGAQTWTNNSGNALNVGTVVNGGFALTLAGAGDTAISGVISGTGALIKNGSGSATLAANTYTGATTVTEGTLTLSGARTGGSGALSVSNVAGLSAVLNITNGTFALGANAFNVGNAPTSPATGTVNQSGGAISFTSGNALLVGQNTVGNQGIYNLSGGSITTFTSTTRGIMLGVNSNPAPGPGSGGGTFNLSGTGVINMTAASGGGGNALLEIGRSDAVANNTTNLFNQTGGTANVGILAMGGGATSGSTGVDSTLTITGGVFAANTFTLLSAAASNTSVINIGGTADVTLPAFPTARGAGSTATLNFDGGTLRPAGASTGYMTGLTNAFIRAGGATFDVPTGRNITVAQSLLTDAVSLGGGLTKTGVGSMILTGTSTYTGDTVIAGGVLQLGSAGATGSLSPAGNIVNNGTLIVNRTNAVIQGVDFSGNPITGTGGFTQAGTGTTTLAGLNSYSGVTAVTAGTLQINSPSSIGDGSATNTITLGVATLNSTSGTYDLGANRSIAMTGAGVIRVDADTLTLSGNISNGASTLSLVGPGSIVVNGVIGTGATPTGGLTIGSAALAARVTLSGNNLFTGPVSLPASNTQPFAVLTLTNSGALGVGPKTVTATGGGEIHLQNNITFASNISFTTSGSAQQNGVAGVNRPVIVNDSGNNAINGNISMQSGNGSTIISSDSGLLTINGNMTAVAATRQLQLRGDGDGEITGVISNGSTVALPVLKDGGSGTWTLSNNNSYTGPTTVTNGVLNINGTIGIGANVVNANGGTTNFGVSQTLSALNIGNGAVVTLSEAVAAPAPEFDLGLLGDASAGIGAGDALVNPAGVAAVPEPGSVALLFGGMLALLGVRRRKNG